MTDRVEIRDGVEYRVTVLPPAMRDALVCARCKTPYYLTPAEKKRPAKFRSKYCAECRAIARKIATRGSPQRP